MVSLPSLSSRCRPSAGPRLVRPARPVGAPTRGLPLRHLLPLLLALVLGGCFSMQPFEPDSETPGPSDESEVTRTGSEAPPSTSVTSGGDTSPSRSATALPEPGDPAAFVLVEALTEVEVGENLAFVVEVQDAEGIAVPGFDGRVRVEATDEDAEGVGERVFRTDDEGRFGFAMRLRTPGEQRVLLTETSLEFGLEHEVEVRPGVPQSDASRLTVDPALSVADGETPVRIRVLVRDAAENPVSAVPVRILTGEESDVLNPADGLTDEAGVFESELRATVQGERIVRANVDDSRFTLGAALRLDGSGPNADNSFIEVAPVTLLADGESEGAVTVVLRDDEGEPSTGRTVQLSSSVASDELGAQQGLSNAEGRFATTIRVSEPGERTLTATIEPGGLVLTHTVQASGTPPDPTRSTFTLAPSSLPADGTTRSILRVTVQDVNGDRVPGVPIRFTSNRVEDVISPASGVANENGFFEADLRSTRSGNAQITAEFDDGAFTILRNASFTSGTVSEETTGFFAGPSPRLANGVEEMTVSVVVRDALNNPVGNVPVAFSSSEDSDVFSASSGVSSGAGSVVVRLTATVAGARELRADFGDGLFFKTRTVTYTAGPPDPTLSQLSAVPAVGSPGTAAPPVRVTLSAVDAFGNPTVNRLVSFTAPDATLTQLTPRTDGDGIAEAELQRASAGTAVVRATVDGVALFDPLEVPFADTFEFGSCGRVGAAGPDAEDCAVPYSGTALEGRVTLVEGVQQWTVPASGLWRVEAVGAQGASGDPERSGGGGARVVGEVMLEAGDGLRILVGQPGEASAEGSAGGGGASALFLEGESLVPLVVAAGGGGVAAGAERDGCPGRVAEEGGAGSGAEGGASFACGARAGAAAGEGGSVSSAETGAGGGAMEESGEDDVAGGGAGGAALQAGGAGGGLLETNEEGTDPCGEAADGGFGGGGSGRGCPGAGGGGGWSGGSGGVIAGGGGSHVSGALVESEAGVGSGAGRVTLTWLPE